MRLGHSPAGCCLVVILALVVPAARAAIPVFEKMPTLNTQPLVADNTTVYAITMTIRDADGYNDIREARTLFNYTLSGGDSSYGRGYLVWGKTDGDIQRYGGVWQLQDANGGGRWGYRTDAWGSDTYVTPMACTMTAWGASSGSTGYRAVTFTFKVKPTWAGNPLINRADAFTGDYTLDTGWLRGAEFDVLAQTPTSKVARPSAPIVTNVRDVTADVTLAPGDSPTDLFGLRIDPPIADRSWVQADGSLGLVPVWRTRAAWGTVRIKGLVSTTSYNLLVRAISTDPTKGPSDYSPEVTFNTLNQEHVINPLASGLQISRGIIGQSTRLDPNRVEALKRAWELVEGSSIRGVAGGMDADTYDWRDMSGQGAGHTGTPAPEVATTLTWMRQVRDYKATIPVITVNTRGTGPVESSGWCRFYYDDLSVESLSVMAADWVRYVNQVLPVYRLNDTLPADVSALLDTIDWFGREKLLGPDEPPTPRVTYWEIGNEPELTLPWCTPNHPTYTISPQEYATRYKQITQAMLAVDPTIKVGPCTIAEVHAAAVLNDPQCQVDFVSYHPYGPLSSFGNHYGDTPESAEMGLRVVKQQLLEKHNAFRNAIIASGRDPNRMEYMASEWNPSSWEWECTMRDRRMSQALGLAETIFTFAELKMTAAHYWSYPTSCEPTGEQPMYKVFQMMMEHLGDELIQSFNDNVNFRMYTTRETATGRLAIWGLNFSEHNDKPVRLRIDNAVVQDVKIKRLRNLSGDTSLFDGNFSAAQIDVDWVTEELGRPAGPEIDVVFEDATVTVVVIEHRKPPRADFDRDGDVDQSDYGLLQACLTGNQVPQPAPECAPARLDNDYDVDAADLALFLKCMAGPNVDVDDSCME